MLEEEVTNMSKKYYSIGEMARLMNVSIQTLRYYDQINLFKPIFKDPVTNYRYYDESQFYYLDLIKALKYVGTPLETIKQMQHSSLEELVDFLAEQEKAIESGIQRLQEVQYTLLKTKKQMEEQLAISVFDEVYIKEEEEARLLYIQVENATPDFIPNEYYSELMKTIENENSLTTGRYGSTFSFQSYNSIKEISYERIFTPILTNRYLQHLSDNMGVLKYQFGRYVCISFLFSVDAYLEQYQKLYTYIREQQLLVEPEVYEFFMPMHYSPLHENQYIIELKVKIKGD